MSCMASVPANILGSLLKFFSLTYALTWTCFIAAAALSGSVAATVPVLAGLRGSLFLLGTFAPAIVALWLAARAEGREGHSRCCVAH
jgi:hypothetical protein